MSEFFNSIDPTLTFATFVIAVLSLGVAIYPIYQNQRDRKILIEKFEKGPFDKATIENSTRFYIKPKCSNLDPAQEVELRLALSAVTDDLFKYIDSFLTTDADPKKHLLVLAESGMGKTSFVLNYYARNARRWHGRQKIAIVPLGIREPEELIIQIPDKAETVLFLDAFDEDTKAVDDHNARIKELMKLAEEFKKVLVTCRTQFFGREEEIPKETGLMKFSPRNAGETGEYIFWKIYMMPFDDKQIAHFIKRRFPIWQLQIRSKAFKIAAAIPRLTVRPMLLAHIPDVIKANKDIQFSFQLYEVMVQAWLERESGWVEKKQLEQFSEKLAVDLFVNRLSRGTEQIPKEELRNLARIWNIDLNAWQLSTRSLLNRRVDGSYKFAHRSVMEYLFVKMLFLGDKDCFNVVLTDQMKIFFGEMMAFYLGIDLRNLCIPDFEIRASRSTHGNLERLPHGFWALLSRLDLFAALELRPRETLEMLWRTDPQLLLRLSDDFFQDLETLREPTSFSPLAAEEAQNLGQLELDLMQTGMSNREAYIRIREIISLLATNPKVPNEVRSKPNLGMHIRVLLKLVEQNVFSHSNLRVVPDADEPYRLSVYFSPHG